MKESKGVNMSRKLLFRTNLLAGIIITIGFLISNLACYQSNLSIHIENVENISRLTSDGMYYQLESIFTKPLGISSSIANDRFLADLLLEEQIGLQNEGYVNQINEYLGAYKTDTHSVFLISASSGRYYSIDGGNRILQESDPENLWYTEFLKSDNETFLNVFSHEATTYVNRKIRDDDNNVIGIACVGVSTDYLQYILKEFAREFGVIPYLINDNGIIQVSTSHTSHDMVDFFGISSWPDMKSDILDGGLASENHAYWKTGRSSDNYIVTRHLSDISCYLVVEHNTGLLNTRMHAHFFKVILQNLLIVILLITAITFLIRKYYKRIIKSTLYYERKNNEFFRTATEHLYDNIYEVNITKNCAADKKTEKFFARLGGARKISYDTAVQLIAEKGIHKDYKEEALKIFNSDNVLKSFEDGNQSLRYELKISFDGENYSWVSINAYILHSEIDNAIHMFVYRRNIDDEKHKEISMMKKTQMDEVTKTYNKTTIESKIQEILRKNKSQMYALLIFDIDNFKHINDSYGHSFGDKVIVKFSSIVRKNFHYPAIIGRIGGDEFIALMHINHLSEAEEQAKYFLEKISEEFICEGRTYFFTASIGIAFSPKDGLDIDTLFKKADLALYESKSNGKNRYTIYNHKSELDLKLS